MALQYTGPDGKRGVLRSGLARSASPELRDLKSNDAKINEIATRTGGRVLPAWEVPPNDWFNKAGLAQRVSPLPVWDWLIPVSLALLLMDVAIRRIALDKQMLTAGVGKVASYIRGFTHTTREDIERSRGGGAQSLEALRRKREEVQSGATATGNVPPPPITPREVEGDLADLVGGASASESALQREKQQRQAGNAASPDTSGSLLAAKRRAQQKIEDKKKE